MVIVLRRALLPQQGVENTVVAAAVFYETFTMLAVGAAVSSVVLVVAYRDQWLLAAAALGSTLLLGVPTVPAIFKWLMGTLGVGRLNPTAAGKLRRVGRRTIVVGWVTIAIGWLVQGIGFWAVLRAMGEAAGGPLVDLALHTAAVALGVVAGFISQIPGGLGARMGFGRIDGAAIRPRRGNRFGRAVSPRAASVGGRHFDYPVSCRLACRAQSRRCRRRPAGARRLRRRDPRPRSFHEHRRLAIMLSTVIPVYNERESLAILHRELDEVAQANGYELDIVLVDDGSTDGSWSAISKLADEDERVRGIRFRRNFGKAAALAAGFRARAASW